MTMTHAKLLRMTVCAGFAALLCIVSPLTVPVGGPIPFALQNFAVMLCAAVLDRNDALCSVLVYLLLGLFLPLFSGGNSGLTALVGPTGGYIWSYLLTVPVICAMRSLSAGQRSSAFWTTLAGCVLAVALCDLCGTLQFCLLTKTEFCRALSVCTVPFLGFDLLKALGAALLGASLRRVLTDI